MNQSIHDPQLTTPLLSLNDISLQRGSRILFQALSLQLYHGQTIWLRGDNGSGKSSLLKACAGLLAPHHGQITHPDHQSVAYLGHQDAHKAELTVFETLEFWSDIYNQQTTDQTQSANTADQNINQALIRVGLNSIRDKKCKTLSAGQSKRLSLARLTLSRATVWLLDEPASALDKNGHEILYQILRTHITKGGGAIIATHDQVEKIGEAQVLTLEPAIQKEPDRPKEAAHA